MCKRHAYHQNWKSNYAYEKARKYKNWKRQRMGWNYPPVNIIETDDGYQLELLVPGFEKEDFTLHLTDRILTVGAKTKEQETTNDQIWKRKEFGARSFERQFELNEKIDTDSIKATYQDGILTITLAKLEDQRTFRQEIQLA